MADATTSSAPEENEANATTSSAPEEKGADLKLERNTAEFLYMYQPCTNAFFFTLIISVLEIAMVWVFMVLNSLEHDADAGLVNFYKQAAAQQKELGKVMDVLNARFSAEQLYPVARFVGAWLFVVHNSDQLFMLVKYVFSSSEIRKNEFQVSGDLHQDHHANKSLTFSILIRAAVEFFLLIGMCLAFLLSPSMKGMMLDLSLSMTLRSVDRKILWFIDKFLSTMPGLQNIEQTLTMVRYPEEPVRLRGLVNFAVVIFVNILIFYVTYLQHQEGSHQEDSAGSPDLAALPVPPHEL